jgi:hypothetical protein
LESCHICYTATFRRLYIILDISIINREINEFRFIDSKKIIGKGVFKNTKELINMSKIDLVFVCSEFDSMDYLPEDPQLIKIGDANDWLWEKYGEKIIEFSKENHTNVLHEKKRLPLTFDIMVLDGTKNQIIQHTEDLLDVAGKTDQVFWHPYVTGGLTSNLKFANHANKIINDPKYSWEAIDGKPSSGIMVVGPGPDKIVRTWKILPSYDYPNTPPIVFGEPVFDADPCFSSGKLKFVQYSNGRGSLWSQLAKKYFNPLEILLNELLIKYYIGV